LATVQGFRDEEIKSAIQELNRSTDAINRQTETLRQQQEALARLLKNEAKDTEARASLDLKHSQVLELDHQAIVSSVAGLSQELELRLGDLDSRGSGRLESIQQSVTSMFAADDKLLRSLEKLGWELETEDPQEKGNVDKLRDICARLIKYSVETCRTKLDRIYLEALEKASQGNGRQPIQAEELGTVQEELESLYSEILPVAQMSVEQQYLEPALKSLSSRNGKSLVKSSRAIDYVGSGSRCHLHFLTYNRYVTVWTICWKRPSRSALASKASTLIRQRRLSSLVSHELNWPQRCCQCRRRSAAPQLELHPSDGGSPLVKGVPCPQSVSAAVRPRDLGDDPPVAVSPAMRHLLSSSCGCWHFHYL
jgi:hypothetical protein